MLAKHKYEFGLTLSEILQTRDIKQIELAKKSGISQSYISQIVTGTRYPDLETLDTICKALKINLSYFLLKSLKIKDRNDDKNKIVEEIQSQFTEIDKLIYPENYDNDNSSEPVITSATKELEMI